MTSAPAPAHAPMPLPVIGQPVERSDAAANRERIMCAARRVLAAEGAAGLSMNAVAAAAGVGKGTIFRRFGDRDGLTAALLDVHTIELQDGFLSGPPPLGPGAPPSERLEAFLRALVHFQVAHMELMLAAQRASPTRPPVYGTFLLHTRRLIEQIDPRLDAPVLAGLLMGAASPPTLRQLGREAGVDGNRLADAVVRLAGGLVG